MGSPAIPHGAVNMKLPYGNIYPKIDPSVFVAGGAQIIGDVEIGPECGVWFNAVIRGDVNTIRIGRRTNIQDGCILHVSGDTAPLRVGDEVTVGHGAILHGCTVADRSLIGMGAIVLDNAKINSYTLVAAGALVTGNAEFPEGVLIAGMPAKVLRRLRADERAMIEDSARHYVEYAGKYCRAPQQD